MKKTVFISIVIACLVTACDPNQAKSTGTITRSPRAETEYDAQLKLAEEQLKAQESMQRRAEALLSAQEEMLKLQQADMDRFEKVLEGWEIQQKQNEKQPRHAGEALNSQAQPQPPTP